MDSNNSGSDKPLIPASKRLPELTFKVIILSIILAAVLAAANAYLALKIGTTISASIPASVLALGILRFFKKHNVLESNIIQTAASAGEGVAAAIAFVLPAMVILHIWTEFSYWKTAFITMLGGVLGVLFSIPLRRVMLNMKTLRFPEGTAIGNVLRASSLGKGVLSYLVKGSLAGGLIAFSQTGLNIISSSLQLWRVTTTTLFGMSFGFTPATFAAGYIVGFEVAISLFVGLIIGWVIMLPLIAHYYGFMHQGSAYDMVMIVWSKQLRFAGVGLMLVGGVWTLLRLFKPVIEGVKISFATLRTVGIAGVHSTRTERDIPIVWVFFGSVIIALLLNVLFMYIIQHSDLNYSRSYLLGASFFSVMYVLIVGFLLATVCAYFTGLIGSTNNPLSGILIMTILLLGVLYAFVFYKHGPSQVDSVAGMIIIITAVIATTAAISNENLQDLKAGKMVGSTPWKQQFILVLGVCVSALVIAPVLDFLFKAYGMGGVFPHPGMNPANMLPAPQAGLLAAVAKGIRTHNLDWNMVVTGALVGVAMIVVDEFLRSRTKFFLPTLAVGLGIYLPPEIITPIIAGGLVNFLVRHKNAKATSEADKKQAEERSTNSVLLACGMVAGSALMGVALSVPFVLLGSSDALSIMPHGFKQIADMLGLATIVGLCWWLYTVGRFKT